VSGLKNAIRVGSGRTLIPAAKTRFATNEINPEAMTKPRIRLGIDVIFREKWKITEIESMRNA
jgi:hypothetical protein